MPILALVALLASCGGETANPPAEGGKTAATETEVTETREEEAATPDLSARRFRMPSGNIGCIFGSGVLRCDILSGLAPQPATACDLDWVGLVLPADGDAEPLCAGDTAYDETAPMLDYGWTWGRSGFRCESRESGLMCTSRGGGSFTLSRAGWTAS
jgi:hypothetical protein